MKSILDEESRKALVNYRMQRADESLEEALILCHTGHYNASMNRLYYACYYAIVAALLQKDVNAATHAGVKTMFNLHFISTGLLSKFVTQVTMMILFSATKKCSRIPSLKRKCSLTL